jgi:hypothetical protein
MSVDAIMAIKKEYGVTKNWMGDPCFPTNYTWDDVKCGNADGNTTRITSLSVSGTYYLAGSTPYIVCVSILLAHLIYVELQILMQKSIHSNLHGAVSKNFALLTALQNLQVLLRSNRLMSSAFSHCTNVSGIYLTTTQVANT